MLLSSFPPLVYSIPLYASALLPSQNHPELEQLSACSPAHLLLVSSSGRRSLILFVPFVSSLPRSFTLFQSQTFSAFPLAFEHVLLRVFFHSLKHSCPFSVTQSLRSHYKLCPSLPRWYLAQSPHQYSLQHGLVSSDTHHLIVLIPILILKEDLLYQLEADVLEFLVCLLVDHLLMVTYWVSLA